MNRPDRLQQSDPVIGEIPSLFDKKPELIQGMLFEAGNEVHDLSEVQDVNLSGKGLWFESNPSVKTPGVKTGYRAYYPNTSIYRYTDVSQTAERKLATVFIVLNVAVSFERISAVNQKHIMQHIPGKISLAKYPWPNIPGQISLAKYPWPNILGKQGRK